MDYFVLAALERNLHGAHVSGEHKLEADLARQIVIYGRTRERLAERKLAKIQPKRIEIFAAFFCGAFGGMLIQFNTWLTTIIANSPSAIWILGTTWTIAIGVLLLGLLFALRIMYSFYPTRALRVVVEHTNPIVENPMWPLQTSSKGVSSARET